MESIYDKIVEMVEKPTWKSLLVDTVKSSGMDPWDIDIEVLADRFAQRIKKMRETSLRVPANAVLASSILLRFKSDSWVFFPSLENGEEEELEGNGKERPRVEIPELPPARRITKRRVTLDDLIRAIEDVMEKEIRKRHKRGIARLPASLDPVNLMRDSFFNDKEDFDHYLRLVWLALNQKRDEDGLVLFSSIVPGKTRRDVVRTLIPILHLANDDKVYLWQEDFFDEIIIKVNENGRGE